MQAAGRARALPDQLLVSGRTPSGVKQAVRNTTIGILLVAGCWAWPALVGCGRAHPDGVRSGLAEAIADVEAGRRSTPLIGEPTANGDRIATFLAQESGGQAPRIVSDVTGWGEHTDGTFDFTVGAMRRIGATGWYSLEAAVAPRARVEYLIAYSAADYRLDPHNRRPALTEPAASEFVVPGYEPPQEFANPPALPAGLVVDTTFESQTLGRPCQVAVYTPPGYRRDEEYPLAVFVDLAAGPVPRVLDWLITRRTIEPIVAAFLQPGDRGNLEAGAQLSSLLPGELLEWLALRYGVARGADGRAVIGISFSAKDALEAALAPTNRFGRLGLLVPGRRISRADIRGIAPARSRRLKVAILAGLYDSANLPTAQGVRQALAEAGHVVDYREVPEGHTPRTWRNHLGEVLVSLFGPEPGRPET